MRRAIALALAAASIWTAAARAEYAWYPYKGDCVRVGFDGKYKAGLWTPVDVILEDDGRSVR